MTPTLAPDQAVTPPGSRNGERTSVTIRSSYASAGGGGIAPRETVPELSTGDTVRHETLGEGIVTRIETGGVVTVRFAGEDTERRLMLDYAPLERVG